jgi:hypothetical protein
VNFDNSKSSERQRDKATVELLRKLREKLLSDNISTARVAALNLSWKQEDGLAILTEALFGNYPRTAKKAAAYGLRSMKGRMQKMGLEVLKQGLKHRDRTTKAACVKSISLMKGQVSGKGGFHSEPASGKQNIREITKKNGIKTKSTETMMPLNG